MTTSATVARMRRRGRCGVDAAATMADEAAGTAGGVRIEAEMATDILRRFGLLCILVSVLSV